MVGYNYVNKQINCEYIFLILEGDPKLRTEAFLLACFSLIPFLSLQVSMLVH